MTERTTVRLPDELVRRAKRKASAEGRTLTALIEEGLRLVVNDDRQKQKQPRVLPPVSTATGGLLPGINLDDMSTYYEMEDLEYAKRFL
jgi:hypothetical protein